LPLVGVPHDPCSLAIDWPSVSGVHQGDSERLDEEEIRRSEDEIATVGNCAGSCGIVVLMVAVLVVSLVVMLRRAW
jgi:hypothetical protein